VRLSSLHFSLLAFHCTLLAAQSPAGALRERAEYVAWLESAPNSPLAAIAHQVIGSGLRLGPEDSDIPLQNVAEHRVTEGAGLARLEGPQGNRPLRRGIQTRLGGYTLTVDGAPGRGVLTVFAAKRPSKRPEHFAYDPKLVFVGPLVPPARPGTARVLGMDGVEVEAYEAGTVGVAVGGGKTRLRVLRIPSGTGEESELEIFFRDGTNRSTTYPAGRFVSLVPLGPGRYRLDFNQARNPFCAYSSAYPCPAPWRGNTIAAPIEAGERYTGGGLSAPPAGLEPK
jgi:uncharacterized protein (DUF1684 family)